MDQVNGKKSLRYVQLAEEIHRQMLSGHLKPGDRLPSHGEMRTLGVSQNTVEKAHELLERRHLVIRKHRSGTYVAAPRPRSQSGLIGFVSYGIAHTTHPYWALLVQGIREAAQSAGRNIVLMEPGDEGNLWDKLDGFLTTDSSYSSIPPLPVTMLPFVSLLDWEADGHAVFADEADGIRQAVKHLIALGHSKIGYIIGPPNKFTIKRMNAYHEAMAAAGLPVDPAWTATVELTASKTFASSSQARIQQWLEEGWPSLGCTALLVHNDDAAIGVITGLQEAGYRVPRDVSVVGFDGVEASQIFRPRLATVEIPLREMGEAGMRLLLEILDNEALATRRVELPVRFLAGETIAPPSPTS